jgi:cell division transport system permease protein
MRGNSFSYLFKEGVKYTWTDRLMTFASIGVLTACLILVGFFIAFSYNINSVLGFIEQQNEIVIFIKDDATKDQIMQLEKQLKADKNITNVKYITKQQALSDEKEKMGENAVLLEGLEGEQNPYPSSFRIKLKDLSAQTQTIKNYENNPIKENIFAQDNIARTLTNLRSMVSTFSLTIIVVLAAVSVLIVINTIKATIFARKKQINIMRYVGASSSFISLPYIIEGICLGLISALIAFLVLWGGYEISMDLINKNTTEWLKLAVENLVSFETISGLIALSFVAGGVTTTTIGSIIGIRKHLKV